MSEQRPGPIIVPGYMRDAIETLAGAGTVQRSVKVTPELWRAIGARAKSDGIGVNAAVRGVLAAYAAGLIGSPQHIGSVPWHQPQDALPRPAPDD